MKNIDLLYQFLTSEAAKVGWIVKPMQLPPAPAKRSDRVAPETEGMETRAFVGGLHPIILAELGSDLTKAPADWAAAQRQPSFSSIDNAGS